MTVGDLTILLSSAGRRVALLRILKQTLRDFALGGELVAADMAPLSSAYHLADRSVLVPRCTSPEFVPAMLQLCRQHRVRLIVPTIDTELPVYAEHRAEFEREGVFVVISSPEVVALGSDKALTHAWLVSAGLPTVQQKPACEVLRTPEGWRFPCIVKPRRGSSSVGVARVDTLAELAAATRREDDIVQAIAPGQEYTIDFLADRGGRCVCAVPRKRLEVRGGEVSKAVTVRAPALQGLARELCERLPGAYGALCVQVFLDETTGELNVIELNPRFGGGFPLTWEAGAHFPKWMLEEILGLPSTAEADAWQDGVVMLRFDDAVFVDARTAGLQ
jgi:carbamoyl-phosphate synthase large subunit